MSNIKFEFIGWCNDTKEHHDKVWVAFQAGDRWYCGWGKRGKALSFKDHGKAHWSAPSYPPHSLAKLIDQKERKGYKHIDDPFLLFSVFPDFEETVASKLTFAVLANKIK